MTRLFQKQASPTEVMRRHFIAFVKSWHEVRFNVPPTPGWVDRATQKIDRAMQHGLDDLSVDRVVTAIELKK